MRYTTWIISNSNIVVPALNSGYGLARINEDGSVSFGFKHKPIHSSSPYRTAPSSDIKKQRNGSFSLKMPEIDSHMGMVLLLIPESCPYYACNTILEASMDLPKSYKGRFGKPKYIDIIFDLYDLVDKYAKENYL